MSQESSPAVVEFGPASGPPDTPEVRRPILSRLLSGARPDYRAVPALAGLGGVAVFVSLISPWQVTMVDLSEAGTEPPRSVDSGLTELGSWGAAYLLGVLGVAACAALVLFGAPAVRRHARLAGLGVSGALLAMMVALTVELSQNSLTYPIYFVGQVPESSPRSGLYLALVGVAALGVAQYLAGLLPRPAGAGERAEEGAAGQAEPTSLWRWRRASKPEPDHDGPPPPADLTVTPTRPFVRGPGQ
jgi:hypothetical protein